MSHRNRSRRRSAGLLVALVVALAPAAAQAALPPAAHAAAAPEPAAASSPGEAYASMGYGVFLHYGLATELDMTPWQYDPHDHSALEYNPSDFDPDQWMQAIAGSGAKYIVFTAKHHDGFTMWPSAYTDWGVQSSAQPDVDVVGRVVAAARDHGLKVVLYYSWYDRFQPGGDVHPKDPSSKRTATQEYLEYAENQLHELLTGYGPIAGLWMDIAPMDADDPDGQLWTLANYIHQVSPGTAFVPNFPSATRDTAPPADVVTFEGGYDAIPCDFSGGVHGVLPLEQAWTAAAGPGWWQGTDDGAPSQTVDQVVDAYRISHEAGATFSLNAPPGPNGLLPSGTVNLLDQVGQRIRSGDLGPPGDPYQVLGDGTRVYDDGTSRCGADDRVHYHGAGWTAGAWPNGYGGTRHYSNTAGDYAELDFDGTGVAVQVQTRPGHGYADISVDGGQPDTVDTYSNPPQDQAVVWHRDGLAPGPHTVRVTVDGLHDPNATNSWVSLDAIRVTPGGAPQQAVTLRAAPDGTGTACDAAQPCSVTQAQTAARAVDGDVVVQLAGGSYRLSAPLRFGAADSGVTWQAAPGAHPVFSGALRVTGWTKHDAGENIWRAAIPDGTKSRQLYVDGLRATPARQKAAGANTVTATGLTSTDPVWATLAHPAGVEVEGMHQWKDQRCPVSSVAGQTITMAQPCWTNGQIQGTTWNKPTWLSNAYEFLDKPGEFFVGSHGRYLYYIPRPGEDLASADVELPVLENLVSGSDVHDVTFRGITFSYATWLGPSTSEGYALGQAGARLVGHDAQDPPPPSKINYYVQRQQRGQLMPGNVSFDHAQHISFADDTFTHLGGAGLALGLGAQNNSVSDSTFADISSNGVEIGDVADPVSHHPDDPADVTLNNSITGSIVTRAGAEYRDCVGVFVGYTTRTTVDHNTIYDLPYSGISVGWGWGMTDPEALPNNPKHVGVFDYVPHYPTPTTSSGNRITNNLIQHVMLSLRDGGGIYTLGAQRETVISGNYITDVPGGPSSVGGAGATGIYTDEGSQHILAQGNVVTQVRKWMSAWDIWSIRDNTYTGNYTDVVQDPPAAAPWNTITDNTVVTDGQWPAVAQQIMDTAGAGRPFATFELRTGQLAAGRTATVTAMFTNTGDALARGVSLRVSAPAGWTLLPPVTPARTVPPGETMRFTYRVSVPRDVQPGVYAFDALARYTADDVSLDRRASATAAVPYASLPDAFNSVCISDESDRTAGNCDGLGYSYPAEALADAGLTPGAAVSFDGLDYTWPDTAPGTPDNAQGTGQQISLSGSRDRVGLLLSAKDGTYTFTLHYADDTADAKTVNLPNWVNKPPTADTALYARLPYRNTPFGTHDTQFQPGIFVLKLPADPTRELRSIELPGTGRVNVFAISS